jgi:ABC-type polysaccharide/polyol phosphate transport system ATPase subunit
MSDVLVKVDNVSKRFCRSLKRSLWYGLQDLGSEIGGRRHGGGRGLPQSSADVLLRPDEFWAVKDVSFELRRGECLGLIGRNGAGKTTLLKMLNGLIKPDTGSVVMRGNIGALIALGAGFNPILTGRENILVSASILGLSSEEAEDNLSDIIEFSEVKEFIDSPIQSYSSGMQARLGFATASFLKPDILLVDEVLAVGDRNFQMKCFNRLGQNIKEGASVILVSHNEHNIARMTSKCLYLEKGSLKIIDKTANVLQTYLKDDINAAELNLNLDKLPKSKTSKEAMHIKSIKLQLETASYLSFIISLNVPAGWSSQSDSRIWIEFLIRDLDGRPLTYYHDYVEIGAEGSRQIHLEFPSIFLNKANYSASCAIWSYDRTIIFDSILERFASPYVDPLNIADFRLPALVTFS